MLNVITYGTPREHTCKNEPNYNNNWTSVITVNRHKPALEN